ncbi:AAA family ATPase [Sphingopyxis panaciterrulae]|uniref:Putative ATPase n=3 Tax=Sphingopyxis TaxID=165697 RepID=A0A7W9B971_9SPHN|nr:ATP-binding protein [Sphingopyxis panaciterrulae]MBB5708381.1 putative ATPase [Sphingopyxis panaciterrulae]SBV32630.1 putative SMC domain-containing protein [uncultured Sphingopyxis sp.]
MTTQFAIRAVNVDLPMLGTQRLSFSNPTELASHSTILVGRNGTGKSTILRDLVMALRAYFATNALQSRQGLGRISSIEIDSEGRHVELNFGADVKQFKDERDSLRGEGWAPSKVIALSFTPFDKFPPIDDTLPRPGSRPETARTIVDPFYVYLGFKNDFRSSPRARLLRTIDQLAFAESTVQSDERVVDAFDAIGYSPVIELEYEFTPGWRSGRYQSDFDEQRLKELESMLEGHVRSDGKRRRRMTYYIDFRFGRRDASIPIDFEEIRRLTDARVLRLGSVKLRTADDKEVELLELSSGELNLFSGFLGLAAFLEDGCLVLIDEPENSLHPDWQMRYTEMLEAVFSRHRGCHYIIATHSPLVVSGVAGPHAKILRLDQEPIELPSRAVANASPDATLLSAFTVVTSGNNFLKQIVLETITLIDTGKHRSARARELALALASIYDKIPEDDPIRDLVAGVVQTILQPS